MENPINFIGKGKKIGNKIQLSFNWNELKKLKKSDFNGEKYLVVDVLPLHQTGKFGHTHTVIEFKRKESE